MTRWMVALAMIMAGGLGNIFTSSIPATDVIIENANEGN